MLRRKVTEEVLTRMKHLYCECHHPIREVAEELNLCWATVRWYLAKMNLTRGYKEALFLRRDSGEMASFKGRRKNHEGYIIFNLSYNDPFRASPFFYKGQNKMLEHRYIMAQHLGRLLYVNETVHHLNGIRDDNRIENLVVVSRNNHPHNHSKNSQREYIKSLQKRIRDLEAELSQQKLMLTSQ